MSCTFKFRLDIENSGKCDLKEYSNANLTNESEICRENLMQPAITLVGYDGDGVRVDLNHLRHLVVLFL